MSSFGDPIAGTGQTEQTGLGQAPSAEPQEVIDPNDPRLISEAVDVNTEGDYYAQPAPPPDHKWRAKLKLDEMKNDKGERIEYETAISNPRNGPKLPYYRTNFVAQIIDPSGKYDGLTVRTAFGGYGSTLARRDGTTSVGTILAMLKRPDGSPWVPKGTRLTQKDWIELFIKALMGEPEIGIETEWSASCAGCGEEARKNGSAYPKEIRGMHHFPAETNPEKRKAGQLFAPELMCQKHGNYRAFARVARFVGLGELPKG